MALADDLNQEVQTIFRSQWDVQATRGVPNPDELRLGNHAKELGDATVLYADLDGSTSMVDTRGWQFAAEVYKTYLRCAARIVNSEGGTITAYDGDRLMSVFTGDAKNTSAVRAGMKIQYAVKSIINPQLRAVYSTSDYVVRHVVGIDTSELRAARIGVRGYNDLVWVGPAANHAAKLTVLDAPRVWITKAVYEAMNDAAKFHDQTGQNMWTKMLWTPMGNQEIFYTEYGWVI